MGSFVEVSAAPSFSLDPVLAPALRNETFVIALLDPDGITPQNPNVSDVRQFLGANFQIDESGKLTNSTPAITEYFPPSPPATSPAHRSASIAKVFFIII
jgi:phosphatidylethanolamine-binding protein